MPSLIPAYRYDRDSVERGLEHHLGPIGPVWNRRGTGYTIVTTRGILHLKTLRETAIYVHAMADTKAAIRDGRQTVERNALTEAV
jgi:hypothetical protein